jgi:hypothetical protein
LEYPRVRGRDDLRGQRLDDGVDGVDPEVGGGEQVQQWALRARWASIPLKAAPTPDAGRIVLRETRADTALRRGQPNPTTPQ